MATATAAKAKTAIRAGANGARSGPIEDAGGAMIPVARLKVYAKGGEMKLWYDPSDRSWCVYGHLDGSPQTFRHRQLERAFGLLERATAGGTEGAGRRPGPKRKVTTT